MKEKNLRIFAIPRIKLLFPGILLDRVVKTSDYNYLNLN